MIKILLIILKYFYKLKKYPIKYEFGYGNSSKNLFKY